ncbi:hypothetical protein [uncultured Roseobacter sp.]|uniref:hypothetical protein n=1 Tax=uncultured Roseobacter sp. TaxID=114847 RepID=UPI0026290694|nr:hypothetical protein [uncultured Roseobacter sp.]
MESEVEQLGAEQLELEKSLAQLEQSAGEVQAKIDELEMQIASEEAPEARAELDTKLQRLVAEREDAVSGQKARRDRLEAIPGDLDACVAEQEKLSKQLKKRSLSRSEKIWDYLDLAHELSDVLSDRVASGLDRTIPEDTADREYLIESETDSLLGKEDLTRLLKLPDTEADGGAGMTGYQLRLNSGELENRVQLLLDHMTGRRIIEEQDTDTYVQRLKAAYSRVAKSSEVQSKELREGRASAAAETRARFAQITRLADFLEKQTARVGSPEHPRLSEDADGISEKAIRDKISETRLFAANSETFVTRVGIFLDRTARNLENISKKFCHKKMISGAVNQSVSVSRAAEIQTFYRPLPLVWAIIVTLITKAVLAHNTALIIHDNATLLLTLTFVATWVFSVVIGTRNRARRMERLQHRTREAFERLTDPAFVEPERQPLLTRWLSWMGLLSPSAEGQTVRFAPEALRDVETNGMSNVVTRPFDSARSARNEKIRVGIRNAVALLIPGALLFVISELLPDPVAEAYVSELSDGQTCLLAKGTLRSASPSNYYVKETEGASWNPAGETQDSDNSDGPELWFTERVFPELLSEAVPRARVTDILSAKDVRLGKMRDCADGIVTVADIGLDAPDKVFPLGLRRDIVSAQKLMFRLLAEGSVSAQDQNEFTKVFSSIRQQLGSSMSEAQTLELIIKGDLKTDRSPVISGGGNTVTQVFETELLGAEAIAGAMRELAGATQDTLSKLVENNTLAIEQLAALRVSPSHTVVPLVLNRDAPTVLVQPPAPSFVVSPMVNMAPSSGVNPFVTYVTMAGSGRDPVRIQNSLFMPFFPDPVDGQDIRVPLDAYKFGLSNEGFRPPSVSGEKGEQDYFSVVVGAIRSCLQNDRDARMEIDIQGHASSSWLGKLPEDTEKHMFNHALAEGRRMGALMKLKEQLTSDEARKITISGRTAPKPLAEFKVLTEQDSPTALAAAYENTRYFELPEDMHSSQQVWLSSVPLLTQDKVNAFEELFARTVIVEVKKVEGTSCALN